MELDLFSEVRFLEIWNVCEEEISVKAAAKCFFVKGHFAVAMLTDVFLSCVSDADLLHCKAFNEWRPYVMSLYYLLFLTMVLCNVGQSPTSYMVLTTTL